MKYKTTLIAKAEIVKPHDDHFRTIADSLKNKYGFDLKPQMDLLYLKSCLVSAGDGVGINDNDDIFTREEAWAARHTPVMKPFNWQHKDKDILGVIYTVQAKDTQGNIIDFNDDEVPNCDFDLWTEAVIFKLIHQDRVPEIEARAQAGKLFVSMEAWFDDYSYGFYAAEGGINKIVARNQNTTFLDKCLRANSGSGYHFDPDSGEKMRVGRVLKSITFGGCGLVDQPANKRSFIETIEPMLPVSGRDDIELLLQKVLESNQEVILMSTQANSGLRPEDVKSAVAEELDSREQRAAQVREQETLKARATNAETRNDELEIQVKELSDAKQISSDEASALKEQIRAYHEAVNKLIKAGATEDTPPEITAIDNATDGDAAFKAKISWIEKSLATLLARAARANELEAKLAEAEATVREQEVRALLGPVLSEEALEKFVSVASKLDCDAYAQWRDEKELMVLEMTRSNKQSATKQKKEGESQNETNAFQALLNQRRSESELINPPTTGEGVKSGVSPEQLRTPRHKIAGSAGTDPAQLLESAQEENNISLAGTQAAADESDSVNPFRVLASCVVDAVASEKPVKSNFDPVP